MEQSRLVPCEPYSIWAPSSGFLSDTRMIGLWCKLEPHLSRTSWRGPTAARTQVRAKDGCGAHGNSGLINYTNPAHQCSRTQSPSLAVQPANKHASHNQRVTWNPKTSNLCLGPQLLFFQSWAPCFQKGPCFLTFLFDTLFNWGQQNRLVTKTKSQRPMGPFGVS